MNSVVDKISKINAETIRQLHDLNIDLLGSKTQLLRLTTTQTSIMGDETSDVLSTVINNAIIKRPFSNAVELFDSQDNSNNNETTALNMYDILPIEIRVPFSGDNTIDEIEIKKDDILVEVLLDARGNKIPFIMQVTRLRGNFFVKQMTGKIFEATLYRGTLETGIQQKIDEYIENFQNIEDEI